MYKPKTKPTKVSPAAYIAKIKDEERRKDCKTLLRMMKQVTGSAPKMWGPSIVGFGSYHYKYASGHEGDACLAGFSSGKVDLTVYTVPGLETAEIKVLFAQLGKYKRSKACVYIRRLSNINLSVLEKIVRCSVAEVKRRYPYQNKPI